jgi:hypothetical protein
MATHYKGVFLRLRTQDRLNDSLRTFSTAEAGLLVRLDSTSLGWGC